MATGLLFNGGYNIEIVVTTAFFCNEIQSCGTKTRVLDSLANHTLANMYVPLMGMRLNWNGVSVSDSLLEGVADGVTNPPT